MACIGGRADCPGGVVFWFGSCWGLRDFTDFGGKVADTCDISAPSHIGGRRRTQRGGGRRIYKIEWLISLEKSMRLGCFVSCVHCYEVSGYTTLGKAVNISTLICSVCSEETHPICGCWSTVADLWSVFNPILGKQCHKNGHACQIQCIGSKPFVEVFGHLLWNLPRMCVGSRQVSRSYNLRSILFISISCAAHSYKMNESEPDLLV